MTRPVSHPSARHLGPGELECLRSGLQLLALRELGDAALAEEVAQETLVRALAALRDGALHEREKLGAFVRGIARHVIADVHRGRERHPVHPLPSDNGPRPLRDRARDPLAALVSREERLRVRAALQSLSSEDRDILRLSFFEGLKPGQIAAALGEPSERIRKRKSRALQRLRDAFFGGSGHDPAAAATDDEGEGRGMERGDPSAWTGV